MRDKGNRNKVLQALKAEIFRRPGLFPEDIAADLKKLALSYYEKFLIKYGEPETEEVSLPPPARRAEYLNVDISGLEAGDAKSFGAEHLCRQVLEKLKLKQCLTALGLSGPQADKALIAIAARAIFCCSGHKTAQILKINSELAACYGIDSAMGHKQLYRAGDRLYEHKAEIDKHLYTTVTDLFNIEGRLVIIAISNTYFETGKRGSKLAGYGRSKEKRNEIVR